MSNTQKNVKRDDWHVTVDWRHVPPQVSRIEEDETEEDKKGRPLPARRL